jgi:hypothetical protein
MERVSGGGRGAVPKLREHRSAKGYSKKAECVETTLFCDAIYPALQSIRRLGRLQSRNQYFDGLKEGIQLEVLDLEDYKTQANIAKKANKFD